MIQVKRIPRLEKSSLYSLCSRNKSVQMPVVLVQDLSSARLSSGLQPDDDALQWTENTCQFHWQVYCAALSLLQAAVKAKNREVGLCRKQNLSKGNPGSGHVLRDEAVSAGKTRQSAENMWMSSWLDLAPGIISSHWGRIDTTRPGEGEGGSRLWPFRPPVLSWPAPPGSGPWRRCRGIWKSAGETTRTGPTATSCSPGPARRRHAWTTAKPLPTANNLQTGVKTPQWPISVTQWIRMNENIFDINRYQTDQFTFY